MITKVKSCMRAKVNRRIIPWLILVGLSFASFIFFSHNAAMYQRPLAQVVSVSTVNKTASVDQFANKTTDQEQKIRVRFLNGKNSGHYITLKNAFNSSEAITQRLKKNDQIFLMRGTGNTWQFKTMKRDRFWIPILIFVLGVLVLLMGKSGRLTVTSLGINVLLFIVTIYLDLNYSTQNIFWLFAGFSLITSILTLGLVMGFKNRLMWTVLVTVLTTTIVTLVIMLVVLEVTHERGMHFELISYITQLPKPLFFSMTLVGILGAVMDEATDMIATLFALEEERPDISGLELVKAGRRVGQEIFGALSNVLFLIFIAEEIPIAILYLRNGNTWGYTYMMNLSLGMVQTLISAIGIVLTVPVGIVMVLGLRSLTSRQKMRGLK